MKKSRTRKGSSQAPAGIGGEASVQVPLPLVEALSAVEDHFLDVCIVAGQRVLEAMMEQDRSALCGPKWKRDAARSARRGGTTRSEVTLGGRRIEMRRPRARSLGGEEARLASFEWASDRDPLDRRTMGAIAAGVSSRGYAGHLDPLPQGVGERSVSKSAVSRRFVNCSAAKLIEWLTRPLEEIELAGVAIDGIRLGGRSVLIALGVDTQGRKEILALHEGSTENATVARALLRSVVDRGIDSERPMLFVIDGSKALAKAIDDVWGERARIQRCQVHKIRNVLDHLPDHMHARVRAEMCKAYEMTDAGEAEATLRRLAASLDEEFPGAAASLREGLEETLTLQRLGVRGSLYRTLRSTNIIENLNGTVTTFTRNVKRWKGGKMVLRWVASALHHAQQRFHRVRGFSELPKLLAALERDAAALDNRTEKAA